MSRKNPRLYPRIYRVDYLTLTGLREVLRGALARAGGVVVDYGCGSGPYRELLPAGCRYVGADFASAGADVVALLPDGRLPLGDGTADYVLSTQVLEHVPDVAAYLRECRRVLRAGGQLVLTTHGNWPYHPCPPTVEDYWRWTPSGLAHLLAQHGFAVREVRPSCAGKLCLIQLMLALHDPARVSQARWRAWVRAGWALGWNLAGLAMRSFAPRWASKGDIVPVDVLIVAERSGV